MNNKKKNNNAKENVQNKKSNKNNINLKDNEIINLKNEIKNLNTIVNMLNETIYELEEELKKDNDIIKKNNNLIESLQKKINKFQNKLSIERKNNFSIFKENSVILSRSEIKSINFISANNNVNYSIPCLGTDIFAEVEEKLYRQFPEYRETNNAFLANGGQVLRFKTVDENNIGLGFPVTMVVPVRE